MENSDPCHLMGHSQPGVVSVMAHTRNAYGSFTLQETDSGTDSDSDSCPVQQ